MRAPEVISPPAVEPVTVAEAKHRLRMYADLTDDDALIASLIKAARGFLERTLARAFVTQTLREVRAVPASGRLRLLRAPVREIVSLSVDGQAGAGPWSVENVADVLVGPGSNAVVTYTAGYGDDAGSLPEEVGLCVKMLVSYWYDKDEPVQTGTIVAELPFALQALMTSLSWGGEIPPR